MNEIECVVFRGQDKLFLRYRYDEKPYDIELPYTDNNAHLNTGDTIISFLAIEKVNKPKTLREMYNRLRSDQYKIAILANHNKDSANRYATIYAVKNTYNEWRRQ